jgi:spoIIIJ-associated protein
MATESNSLEIRGDNVDAAVAAGLGQLGVGRDQVEIEVLDAGSSGFFGLGGRQAVVRLTVRRPISPAAASAPLPPAPPAGPTEASPSTLLDWMRALAEEQELEEEEPEAPIRPAVAEEPQPQPRPVAAPIEPAAEEAAVAESALRVVRTLLQKINVEATVDSHYGEPDDRTHERRLVVEVHGQDLGVLIGPRGETLAALQMLARLMVGHETHQRVGFMIDIEGYRQRREQALARLAERMADKALKRRQPVSLEPMPANERRIIHLALRDNPRVHTESIGEGPRRRVRIFPSPKKRQPAAGGRLNGGE